MARLPQAGQFNTIGDRFTVTKQPTGPGARLWSYTVKDNSSPGDIYEFEAVPGFIRRSTGERELRDKIEWVMEMV